MKRFWRPIDWVGKQIHTHWTALQQIRTGVLMTLAGLALAVYGIRTSEPFLVYEMSAFALVFAGMGVVITAVLALETSDTADTVDDLIEQEGES